MNSSPPIVFREVRRALDADDYPAALTIAQAAYREATDDATRVELLLILGPHAASKLDEQ
ncbi:hypothetical protein ACFV0B_08845 [Streptomyces xanthophaeus]|uniref:hypothetical protein n=1 Tax=Streptomyces xanthophaeus TaxID=67385 RepID=UPI003676DBA0